LFGRRVGLLDDSPLVNRNDAFGSGFKDGPQTGLALPQLRFSVSQGYRPRSGGRHGVGHRLFTPLEYSWEPRLRAMLALLIHSRFLMPDETSAFFECGISKLTGQLRQLKLSIDLSIGIR
jgi:hypothetical protein